MLPPGADAAIYSMLFFDKLDLSSPRSHLSQARLNFQNTEREVQHRNTALTIVQRRDFWDPNLTEALARVYVMLLEDDEYNWEQVIRAGLPTFVLVLIRERLLEGASDNHGWPLENGINTLAISLFWLITSRDRLDQETDECRREIMNHLAPFAFAGFRYPCFGFPEDLFLVSESVSGVAVSNYTDYLADRPTKITLEYFGQPTTLRLPPIAPFAILGYFARTEYFRLKTPPELPLNRQDAVTKGILYGPTRVDIDDVNARCVTRVSNKKYGDVLDKLPKSLRHDPDWHRSLSSANPAVSHSSLVYYIPGTFSGRWLGSFVAPYQEDYRSMLCFSEAPSPFPTYGRFPLYVQFREMYCCSPSTPLPIADDEISFFNAFLPLGCQWREDETGIEFIGANNSFRTRYTQMRPSGDVSDISRMGLQDVIITGVTEAPYATAWNGYRYIGRVRPLDGLVVLLREPLDPQRVGLGRALFRGYVISSRNFVGRWRHIASAEQPPAWECIFSLCKELTSIVNQVVWPYTMSYYHKPIVECYKSDSN